MILTYERICVMCGRDEPCTPQDAEYYPCLFDPTYEEACQRVGKAEAELNRVRNFWFFAGPVKRWIAKAIGVPLP